MRFRLRTLLLVLAVSPPILAAIGIAAFGLRREPTTATGTVTYRGMPVALGKVSFVPHSIPLTNDKPQHEVKTDQRGRFRMHRDALGKPLQGGQYAVHLDWRANGNEHIAVIMTYLESASANELCFDLQ